MRRVSYYLWGAWLLAGIILKILGLVSWWAATSAIWLPLGGTIAFGAIVFLTADITAYIKKKKDSKIPDECGNCLFGRTTDLVNATKKEGEEKAPCLGEKLANAKRGQICQYYQRAE